MIVKLIFIQTSFFILSISSVDSYVFFAANVDDFRSLAKKVIPGHLADQIASMAGKQNNMDNQPDIIEEKSEYDSKDVYSNESEASSEDSDYSEAYYKTTSLQKTKENPKKSYVIGNKKIDLDELVKRVKDKLEKEYNVNTDTQYGGAQKQVASKGGEKLEDYYYKDEIMNKETKKFDEYKYEPEQPRPPSPAFISKIPKYEVETQYDEVNIDYSSQILDRKQNYPGEAVKKKKYGQNIVNKNTDHTVVTLKEIVRNQVQKEKKFDEYGNVIAKETPSIVTTTEKYLPKYIKSSVKTTTTTERDIDIIYTEANLNEAPEYYDDNVKEAQVVGEPAAAANGKLFKEIDMLQSGNDSYEDYVTPKRDNIFDSGETISRQPIKHIAKPVLGIQKFSPDKTHRNSGKIVPLSLKKLKAFREPGTIPKVAANEDVVKPPAKRISALTTPGVLIRAKTASMWYKDPNIANYDESAKKLKDEVNTPANKQTTKLALRTMFPTKAHIKISSPNYFAKLPAVAEKYNFNEPIPEKDREPEQIKHIGNPPAFINKKVKLT